MNPQFVAAINQICAEKNVEQEVVLDAVKSAIAAAYRKDYGHREQEIEVELKDGVDFATILMIKEVVEKVENEHFEISLKEGKKIKKNTEIGDEIKIDVTPLGYGRIAAQAAKQIILQRVNEAERKALFARFKDREGTALTAMVNRTEGSQVCLEIEKTMVILPVRQQIPTERYFPGKRMIVYLEQVAQTTKGPQLQISRIHPQLVKKLLEREIPEIEHGEVEVKAISRDAGFRSKVAVKAEDNKIDPVGACIGQRGARISPVMEELGGERVDIIEWDDNSAILIARALQPAEICNVIIVTPEEYTDEHTGKLVKKRAAVFVDEAQRAMAIGKKGQNIRLASELTGFELDMYNAEEYEPFKEKLEKLMGDEATAGSFSKVKEEGGEVEEVEEEAEKSKETVEKKEEEKTDSENDTEKAEGDDSDVSEETKEKTNTKKEEKEDTTKEESEIEKEKEVQSDSKKKAGKEKPEKKSKEKSEKKDEAKKKEEKSKKK